MTHARRLGLAVALAVHTIPTFAYSPQVPVTFGSATFGVEVADHDSRRVYATGGYDLSDQWSVTAGVARTDFDLSDTGRQSTVAGIMLDYGIDAVSVGGGFMYSKIDGVSRGDDWLLRGSWHDDMIRLGLEVGHRATILAPSAFTENLGGDLGIASGTSHCGVDGVGYRASVDLERATWTWSSFATLRVFDYDDYDCALSITSGGGSLAHAHGGALARRLSTATLGAVVGATSRLVPPEAALLESSASIGFRKLISLDWRGGLEIDRLVEKLDGSEYLTGILSATRELDNEWSLELSLGYAVADKSEDTAFAGVRVTRYFRR